MSRNMEFSPVPYDVMRELATMLSGRYLARMRSATTEEEQTEWRERCIRVTDNVDAVNSLDHGAIARQTQSLRDALSETERVADRNGLRELSSDEIEAIFDSEVRPYLDHLMARRHKQGATRTSERPLLV